MIGGYCGGVVGVLGGVAGDGTGFTGPDGVRGGEVGSDLPPHPTTLRVMKRVAVPVTIRESPFIPCPRCLPVLSYAQPGRATRSIWCLSRVTHRVIAAALFSLVPLFSRGDTRYSGSATDFGTPRFLREVTEIRITINIAITIDDVIRLRLSPPCA